MTLSFADLDALRAWRREGGCRAPDPADEEAVHQGLLKAIRRDPLYRRYLNHLDSVHVNREPWTAIGERLYAAGLVAMADRDPMLRSRGFDDAPSYIKTAFALRMATLSVPYLWLNDVENVIQAMPLPRHVISRTCMPFPCMFLSRETAWPMRGIDGVEVGEQNWLYLEDQGSEGITILSDLCCEESQTAVIAAMSLRYGKTWPDDFPPDEREATAQVLRRLAFIASPYTDTEAHRLPRPIRREMARLGTLRADEPEPLCYTVKLRRPAPNTAPCADDGTGREYHHRWWVSAHFRAQWYPSEGAHKFVWIAPHVKGPPDKPMITKTYVVAR